MDHCVLLGDLPFRDAYNKIIAKLKEIDTTNLQNRLKVELYKLVQTLVETASHTETQLVGLYLDEIFRGVVSTLILQIIPCNLQVHYKI
jgi:hypothetical protein